MERVCFVRNHQTLPKWLYHFAIPLRIHRENYCCPHSHRHLMLSVFWILVILICVQWYLVSVCFTVMTCDVEYLSHAYLSSVYFLWWDVCWGLWPIFLLELFELLLFLSFCVFISIFESACLAPQKKTKNLLRFWLGLNWFYKLIWGS